MLAKNLGYVTSDFDESFLLMHSFGSGNLHYFELIEKTNGKVLLSGEYLDVNQASNTLLYATIDTLTKEDILSFYDIKTKKIESFELPSDIDCAPHNCIKIKSITKENFIIEYENKMGASIKKYNR